MTNREKYIKAFSEALEIEEDQVEGLHFMEIPEWDDVGHEALIAELEEMFDFVMDEEDADALESFEKGIEILGQYDIEVEDEY